MLICPAPSGSVQIHATGFVDIYKDRAVFDDVDQHIMMLTTEGGEEGILTGEAEKWGNTMSVKHRFKNTLRMI